MLRWWRTRKMRWAVRRVASFTAQERERLLRQHSTNRISRRLGRLVSAMYGGPAEFSISFHDSGD